MTSPSVEVSDLNSLGIDEVEPSICEDTHDNRRRLRGGGFMWDALTDEIGNPTGLIKTWHGSSLVARRDSVWERRKPIMQNPDDRYSEYRHPDEYPLDFDMPQWLASRLRWWSDDDKAGKPESERRPFPERCETVRTDGTRCWNWAPEPRKVKRCKQHVPWTADLELHKAQIARHRLLQAAPMAADTLEDLALNASGEAVRLKASTEILDRVGVRGGIEIDARVEVEQVDPSKAIREKLQRLADNPAIAAMMSPPAAVEAEVVEAEVVE